MYVVGGRSEILLHVLYRGGQGASDQCLGICAFAKVSTSGHLTTVAAYTEENRKCYWYLDDETQQPISHCRIHQPTLTAYWLVYY